MFEFSVSSSRVRYYETDCSAQHTMSVALGAKQTYSPDVIIGPPCSEGAYV